MYYCYNIIYKGKRKMSKKNALPKFNVNFNNKKTQFNKDYVIDSQDEPTAWLWVEKQRDVWIKTYQSGEMDISDPKSWKVSITAFAPTK